MGKRSNGLARAAGRPIYIRDTDDLTMIEVAPGRAVNLNAAAEFGLITDIEFREARQVRAELDALAGEVWQ